jgi:hypothetical protein
MDITVILIHVRTLNAKTIHRSLTKYKNNIGLLS